MEEIYLSFNLYRATDNPTVRCEIKWGSPRASTINHFSAYQKKNGNRNAQTHLCNSLPIFEREKYLLFFLKKRIPVELITEVPWSSTIQTPKHNPLEKLPVSHPWRLLFCLWVSLHSRIHRDQISWESPLSFSQDIDEKLFAKEAEVVVDGTCDVLALLLFEKQRAEGARG